MNVVCVLRVLIGGDILVNLNNICSGRKISDKIITPLIVPSFSSKGFSEIANIYEKVKEQIVDCSLISAYDLHYGNMPEDFYFSDIIIIDSGGYEKRKDMDLAEIYKDEYIPKQWDIEQYKCQLSKLRNLAEIIIVNYDNVEPTSVENQITEASNLFNQFNQYMHDFLCKPTRENSNIYIDEWISSIHKLSDFNIIGFTEKELGDSIETRCKNLVKFRRSLNERGLNTPIHIFGCIDPLNILAYFLCGADIFDGLLWLRLSFHSESGLPIYNKSLAITQESWSIQDKRLELLTYGENLKLLSMLKSNMHKFARTHDWGILDKYYGSKLKELIISAGIVID